MPLIATRGAASSRGFGQFSAPSSIGGPYWIGLLGSGNPERANSNAVDSSGNLYLCGNATSGTQGFQIAKYNSSGTIQWQRRLADGLGDYGNGISVDSSGNVYVSGVSGGGSGNGQIAKYDTSGTLQWQRNLSISGQSVWFEKIGSDSSGNVYVCGYSYNPTRMWYQIVKYDTSGTIQWQKWFGAGSYNNYGLSISVDSSGNIYVIGYSTPPGPTISTLAKFNTSGTLQWQRKLSSTNDLIGYAISFDSSGNVYAALRNNDGGQYEMSLVKYNSSGTLQWQRKLGSAYPDNDVPSGVATDSTGNVYLLGTSNAGLSDNLLIAKYDTSGTIQWQRRLGGTSVSESSGTVSVDISGNVYVCGSSNASGNSDFFFAKLKSDGSLTGTYTVGGYSITYTASSLTDSADSLTDAAGGLSDTSSTATDAASSLSGSTTSLTSSVTTI